MLDDHGMSSKAEIIIASGFIQDELIHPFSQECPKFILCIFGGAEAGGRDEKPTERVRQGTERENEREGIQM